MTEMLLDINILKNVTEVPYWIYPCCVSSSVIGALAGAAWINNRLRHYSGFHRFMNEQNKIEEENAKKRGGAQARYEEARKGKLAGLDVRTSSELKDNPFEIN